MAREEHEARLKQIEADGERSSTRPVALSPQKPPERIVPASERAIINHNLNTALAAGEFPVRPNPGPSRPSRIETHSLDELSACLSDGLATRPLSIDNAICRRVRNMGYTSETSGGYVVPSQTSEEVIEIRLQQVYPIRRLATVDTAKSANDFRSPVLDDGGTEGQILNPALANSITTRTFQGGAAEPGDPSFGVRESLGSKFTSGLLKCPHELLRDSPGMLAVMLSAFARRIGRRQGRAFATGTGNDEPIGLCDNVNLGVTAASSTAIAVDECLDLVHSVDPEYMDNPARIGAFMAHASVRNRLFKLKDGEGRSLWQTSGLSKFPFVCNNNFPSTFTTGTKLLWFGDFAACYKIRLLERRIISYGDRFRDTDQEGLELIEVADGFVIDDMAVKCLKLA